MIQRKLVHILMIIMLKIYIAFLYLIYHILFGISNLNQYFIGICINIVVV
jgi:hypothetical protein